jgi:DmsE family decaheme c-type cytochrome
MAHQPVTKGCKSCHTTLNAENVPHTTSNNVEKGLFAMQPDLCFKCHDKSRFLKKTVHAAVDMGCSSCHNPHTSKNPRLLVSALPDLCYGCHDKLMFTKKTVHPALDMGCMGCHNPHSTENAKLTLSTVPDLCYTCHDKAAFNKKNVHTPVAQGMCLTCHGPHSSDSVALLNKEPDAVCLDCHAEIAKKPHGTKASDNAGYSGAEHAREFKKTCVSCHVPHSSDSKNLLRS